MKSRSAACVFVSECFLTVLTEVELGQVPPLIALLIERAVISLLVRAQVHRLVLHSGPETGRKLSVPENRQKYLEMSFRIERETEMCLTEAGHKDTKQ